MRPIKFRAWDTLYKEMIYDVQFRRDDRTFDNFLDSRYTLMQFTGLTDKNGKEIYEGDIVDCTHWFFDGAEVEEHFRASVGFRGGSFTLEHIHSKYYSDYTGENNGEGVCWIGAINYNEEDYEVIGNIYESPELLSNP